MIVELEDKPGQLLKTLEPISRLGGNIVGIIHQRGKKTPLNRIPVEITIKIDAKKILELKQKFESEGIILRSIDEISLIYSTTILLIGHVIHTDMSDTVMKIDSNDAECVEIIMSMPKQNNPSTALLTIAARSEEALREAVERLKKVCNLKGIEVIEPVEEL
ncbi:MAG: amino acid-binding protein [Archaeoglobales archaeon]|nr:amino acid-binding protein [Archaeoglobales archaeon]